MSTKALEELYPHMNAEEIAKQRSLNDKSTNVEYKEIAGTPFRIGIKEEKYYLLMGNWKLTQEGEETDTELKLMIWLKDNNWKITQRMIGCICYDFMKPLATIQGLTDAGAKINLQGK